MRAARVRQREEVGSVGGVSMLQMAVSPRGHGVGGQLPTAPPAPRRVPRPGAGKASLVLASRCHVLGRAGWRNHDVAGSRPELDHSPLTRSVPKEADVV